MTLVNPESPPEIPELSPRLSRRERVHQATKADLVAASRAILVEEGLTAVTVRAVASRLGMTAPAIYRYYDGREALLQEVVDLLRDPDGQPALCLSGERPSASRKRLSRSIS